MPPILSRPLAAFAAFRPLLAVLTCWGALLLSISDASLSLAQPAARASPSDSPSGATQATSETLIAPPSGWSGALALAPPSAFKGWNCSALISRLQNRLNGMESKLRRRSMSEARDEAEELDQISIELLRRAVHSSPPLHSHGLYQILRMEALCAAMRELCEENYPAHARACHRQAKRLVKQLPDNLPDTFLRQK